MMVSRYSDYTFMAGLVALLARCVKAHHLEPETTHALQLQARAVFGGATDTWM